MLNIMQLLWKVAFEYFLSIPTFIKLHRSAWLAQSVEHVTLDRRVLFFPMVILYFIELMYISPFLRRKVNRGLRMWNGKEGEAIHRFD